MLHSYRLEGADAQAIHSMHSTRGDTDTGNSGGRPAATGAATAAGVPSGVPHGFAAETEAVHFHESMVFVVKRARPAHGRVAAGSDRWMEAWHDPPARHASGTELACFTT